MTKNISFFMSFVLAAGALGAVATGCELITAIDRNKIGGTGGTGGTTTTGGTSAGGTTGGTAGSGGTGATGGTGGDTSTSSTGGETSSSSSSSTGTMCSGGAMSCGVAADCPAPANDCLDATCDAGCCGTANKASDQACNSGGGKVCDGNGACVECNAPAQCPDTGTVCATATCDANKCGTSNASKGTACADNGGVVCDGNGACVAAHCMDGVQDAGETDKDCGGSCPKCADALHCSVDADCSSAHCLGNNPGTCVACIGAGDCPPTGNECITPTCVANACGTMNLDQTHTLSTGQTTGDCQKVVCNGAGGTTSVDDLTDLPASSTVCKTTPACTGTPAAPSFTPAPLNTDCSADNKAPKHLCGGGALAGVCVECNSAANCNAAGCNGATFTAAGTCDAAGACVAGAQTNCAATGKVCDVASGCVACNAPSDCPATGNECIVNTCNSHVCGTQNLDQTHVLSTGQTTGNCQKIVCNGAGATTSVDDPADLPVSNTLCLTTPACTGSPLAPSFTPATPGTDCTADNQPPAHLCGDGAFTGSCVECNGPSDCVSPATCTASHTCQ